MLGPATTHLIIHNLLPQNSFRNQFLKESKVILDRVRVMRERERERGREREREGERELINYLSAKCRDQNISL